MNDDKLLQNIGDSKVSYDRHSGAICIGRDQVAFVKMVNNDTPEFVPCTEIYQTYCIDRVNFSQRVASAFEG